MKQFPLLFRYYNNNSNNLYNNKYNNKEEIASFFAAMPLDGPQLGNPKTKPVITTATIMNNNNYNNKMNNGAINIILIYFR